MLYDRPDWNMFEIEVEIRSLLLNWGPNCINSRPRTKVKKAANFRAAVWFLAGMQLHWFLN
jgi:hypothetical protein